MDGRVRLTRAGFHALGLAALTFVSALASGNNLLYLLWGAAVGAFAVSWAWLRLASAGLTAAAPAPESARAGAPVRVEVRAANSGRVALHGLKAVHGPQAVPFPPLPPGSSGSAAVTAVLPWRGRNALAGLRLRTEFPFGLLAWEGDVPCEALALPRPAAGLTREEVEALCEASGVQRPRPGPGDEFLGLRPYQAGDDPRLMNWKATLRTGRPLVNECAEPAGSKVTVRAEDLGGTAGERRAGAAAAALERLASSGAEFRLAVAGETTPFGTGTGQLRLCLEALAKAGDGASPRTAPPPDGAPRPSDPPADLTAAGGLLTAAGVLLVDDIEAPLVWAALPLMACGLLMDRRRLPRVPAALWGPVSAAALAYVLLVDRRSSGITLANTHLLLYMLVNRALVAKDPADLRQYFYIQFLACFLVSGQTISPWYFPFFMAAFASASLWLWASATAEPPRAACARAARPAGAVLALAAALFVVTPRLEPLRQANPFLELGLDKRRASARAVTGFTENVSLGFFGTLRRSSARVMRVKPLDGWPPPPAPGAAPRPFLMVRGAAFDSFDGRAWKRTEAPFRWRAGGKEYHAADGRAWAPKRSGILVLPGGEGPPGPGAEVTLYPLNTSVVFTPFGVARLEAPEGSAWFDLDDTVRLGSPALMGTTYRVWAPPRPGLGFSPAFADYGRLVRERYLGLPPGGDPRTAALAGRVTRGAAAPLDKVRAVSSFLRSRYRYSLYSKDAAKGVDSFLFESREGNCEYFATAAAVLLRHAGVPTRLVAGFLADEFNEYGGFYDVRQSQAHAWVEAWTGDSWVAVDATPPASDDGRAGRWLARAQRWAAAAQLRWYRNVIGYDSFVQRDALRRARLSEAREAVGAAAEALWPAAQGAAGVLLALLAAAAARRRALRARAGPYEKAERLLAAAGMPRGPAETPREHAAAVGARRPELAAYAALAELHYRKRFGPPGPDAGARAEMERLLGELSAALRRPPERV